MKYTNCEFFNPVDFEGKPPTEWKIIWNFKNMICETETEVLASPVVLVETEEGNFWLNKSWTFGELFISFVLVVFLVVIISKSIWNFFYPVITKIKRKYDI